MSERVVLDRTSTRREEGSVDAPAPWRAWIDRLRGARRTRRRGRQSLTVILCFVILGLFVLSALFADWLAPHDPVQMDLRARLSPPLGWTGSVADYPLGTDPLGRDMLSRLIYGARVSLAIGFIGALIGLVAGTISGLLAGFLGGFVEEGFMFLVDAYIALPFLVIALTVIAIFGSSLTVLVLVAGFSGWASYTRLARGQVLSTREQQYVLAARAIGAPPHRIMLRHILPNIAAPMIVLATFDMTSIILLESSLSFLGLGIQPPTPAWGAMLGEGRDYLSTAWWVGVLPGVAIVLLTTAISLLGDWLRDLLDPTLRR